MISKLDELLVLTLIVSRYLKTHTNVNTTASLQSHFPSPFRSASSIRIEATLPGIFTDSFFAMFGASSLYLSGGERPRQLRSSTGSPFVRRTLAEVVRSVNKISKMRIVRFVRTKYIRHACDVKDGLQSHEI